MSREVVDGQLVHPTDRLARAWSQPDAFGFCLLTLFLDRYGTEGLGWSPLTIDLEIRDDFGVDLPPGNFDRLMTAIDILTSNAFFTQPADFARGCAVLAGVTPMAHTLLLPDCAEIAWGLTEALLIQPPEPGREESTFSTQVRGFIGVCLDEEGFVDPPDLLRLGLRESGYRERALSHDPDTLQAIHEHDRQRGQAVLAFVHQRSRELFQQLRTLPLEHGQAAALSEQVLVQLDRAAH